MLVGRSIAVVSIYFTGNTRLPMVAGWDNLLPGWFSRLHRRYKTPVNSILFVGIVTLLFAIVSQLGVGAQEAFQLIDNAAGIFYGIAYLALFAIPICGLRALPVRASLWLRIAATIGFLVTLLYIVLTIVPIVQVESRHRIRGENHYHHTGREPARRPHLRCRPPSPAGAFRVLNLDLVPRRFPSNGERGLPALYLSSVLRLPTSPGRGQSHYVLTSALRPQSFIFYGSSW